MLARRLSGVQVKGAKLHVIPTFKFKNETHHTYVLHPPTRVWVSNGRLTDTKYHTSQHGLFVGTVCTYILRAPFHRVHLGKRICYLLLSVCFQLCFDNCVDMGATHMATQYGEECWCADDEDLDHERHGGGAECSYPCSGDEVKAL